MQPGNCSLADDSVSSCSDLIVRHNKILPCGNTFSFLKLTKSRVFVPGGCNSFYRSALQFGEGKFSSGRLVFPLRADGIKVSHWFQQETSFPSDQTWSGFLIPMAVQTHVRSTYSWKYVLETNFSRLEVETRTFYLYWKSQFGGCYFFITENTRVQITSHRSIILTEDVSGCLQSVLDRYQTLASYSTCHPSSIRSSHH